MCVNECEYLIPHVEMSTRIVPGGKGGHCVRFTISLPSLSPLSRKCGILDVSHNTMGNSTFTQITTEAVLSSFCSAKQVGCMGVTKVDLLLHADPSSLKTLCQVQSFQ
jgi:hypothetical protein